MLQEIIISRGVMHVLIETFFPSVGICFAKIGALGSPMKVTSTAAVVAARTARREMIESFILSEWWNFFA